VAAAGRSDTHGGVVTPSGWHADTGAPWDFGVHRPSLLDKRHRLPGEITSHAVWLYYQDGIIPDIFVQPRRIACPDGRHSRKQQEVLVTIVQPTRITASPRAAAPAAPPEPGAGDSPARPLRALQTGHVGVNVTDAERSGRFYREVFGLDRLGESQEDGRRFVFLGHAEKLVLTLWQQSAGRFDAARPGLHHLSFQVESIEDVRGQPAKGFFGKSFTSPRGTVTCS